MIRLGLWVSGNNSTERNVLLNTSCQGHRTPTRLVIPALDLHRVVTWYPPVSPWSSYHFSFSSLFFGNQPLCPAHPGTRLCLLQGEVFATTCAISLQQSLVCFSPSPLMSVGAHACPFYMVSHPLGISVLEMERMLTSEMGRRCQMDLSPRTAATKNKMKTTLKTPGTKGREP